MDTGATPASLVTCLSDYRKIRVYGKGLAEKSGINIERIAIFAGTAFAAGSFVVTRLSYVRPTDSAHPIHFQFPTRTVSFPLWGAIFGITAVAILSFFLGLKRFGKADPLPGPPGRPNRGRSIDHSRTLRHQ